MRRWLPIVGFDAYEVSDHGDVRRLEVVSAHGGYRPRKLRPRLLSLGNAKYPTVTLWADAVTWKVRVHVLVARAFLGDEGEGPLVRHLDDNPWNNYHSNLAWGTTLDNARDRIRLGTSGKKLTAEDVKFIKARLAQGIRGDARLLARHLRGDRGDYLQHPQGKGVGTCLESSTGSRS